MLLHVLDQKTVTAGQVKNGLDKTLCFQRWYSLSLHKRTGHQTPY